MTRRQIVRPNRWDNRERCLEDSLQSLVQSLKTMHPEDFEGNCTLKNLDVRVRVRRAEKLLEMPMYADLEGRVRHPLIRWWREWQTQKELDEETQKG